MRKCIIATLAVVMVIAGCTGEHGQNPVSESTQAMIEEQSSSVERQSVPETTAVMQVVEQETTTLGGQNMDLSNITINTQSSIRIAGSKVIYFDPISMQEAAADADVLLVTHEHSDHFEPNSMKKVSNANTKVVAPESMRSKVLAAGFAEENCIFLEPNAKVSLDGLEITAVWAYNVNKAFHEKSRNWLGYQVMLDGVNYYVAGDTDVNDDVKKVHCDVAFLPIGGTYTMDWKEASDYIIEYRPCKVVIPTHYGSIVGSSTDGESFCKQIESNVPEIQVELMLNK